MEQEPEKNWFARITSELFPIESLEEAYVLFKQQNWSGFFYQLTIFGLVFMFTGGAIILSIYLANYILQNSADNIFTGLSLLVAIGLVVNGYARSLAKILNLKQKSPEIPWNLNSYLSQGVLSAVSIVLIILLVFGRAMVHSSNIFDDVEKLEIFTGYMLALLVFDTFYFGLIMTVIGGTVSLVWYKLDISDIDKAKRLRQSKEDKFSLLQVALEDIEDWYTIDEENRTWSINPPDDMADDPHYLLYLLGAKLAYLAGIKSSPRVSWEELDSELELHFPVGPFVTKSEEYLITHYDSDQIPTIHGSPEDAYVEFNLRSTEEALEWILEGTRNPPT
jgi:hypothetical protein